MKEALIRSPEVFGDLKIKKEEERNLLEFTIYYFMVSGLQFIVLWCLVKLKEVIALLTSFIKFILKLSWGFFSYENVLPIL